MVTSPTSLGAVIGSVSWLPRVALDTVSRGILHDVVIFNSVVYLWTLIVLGDPLPKSKCQFVIGVSTVTDVR